MVITPEEFERRAAVDAYEGWWSEREIDERALAAETAAMLVLLLFCNAAGVPFPTSSAINH